RSRAGRPFWRASKTKVRLRQIRRRPPQHLVLLLQQPHPATQFTILRRLITRGALTGTLIDLGLLNPPLHTRRRHTKVFGDLTQRHPRTTATSHSYNIVTRLSRIRLGHNDILSREPSRDHRSGVTNPCTTP